MRGLYNSKVAVLSLLLLGVGCVRVAKADIKYEISSFTGSHIPFDFSFTEPTFLTSTTTIPQANLSVVTPPDNCTISSAGINNPSSTTPNVVFTLAGCSINGDSASYQVNGFTGPFSQDGAYSNGAALASVVTISGAPAAAVPEPGSVSLLLTAFAAAALFAKKQIAS